MIRCGFEQGAALMGCTSVQNIFILEYMPKAPELYCKSAVKQKHNTYGKYDCYTNIAYI